ncbi:MAG TPA: carboxypeptidase-like regulatory domain-containing protein [Pyrinomonadaceae bacterium]|nr:carboxypeptidase-like regulatory domain-containing protein [Pyrinomonadaceae bacterium]
MKFVKISILFILISAFSSAIAFSQDTGGIKGKVRTTRGNAISGVTITARQNGEDVKSVASDGGGKFVLENLKTGIYNIVFTKNGYSSGLKYDVEVRKGKVGDLGDRLILTVDQGTQVIIKGSVFSEDGRSVSGAEVKIERISENGSAKKIGSIYTNVSGEFTFRQPESAAKFRVTASAKGASASKEVEVSSAAIYRLAITLKVSSER